MDTVKTSRIQRLRPMRRAISLPRTLETVPSRLARVATTVGTRKFGVPPPYAAAKVRKVTSQERMTNISQVCAQ